MTSSGGTLQLRRALAAVAVVLLVLVVLRSAWVSDDAFISFRAATNLIDGHGLVSNPGERVQAFTSPLWTLLVALAYLSFRDVYLPALALSLLCTLGVGLVLASRREVGWSIALAPLLLTVSYAFVSFSTSGLENSLAHLLLAAFCVERLRSQPSPWRTWLLAGLVAFNRLDHVLLVLPVLVVEVVQAVRHREIKRLLFPAATGLAPVAIWHLWATFYYGFPLPNTAYAKLNLDVPRWDLVSQGLTYLVDATLRDPILLLVLGVAGILVWRDRKQCPAGLALAGGAGLYLLYVINIGGDFMSGRFLTAPFLIAAVLTADAFARVGGLPVAAAAALALLYGRAVLEPLAVEPKAGCYISSTGIVDERECYVTHTGLVHNLRHKRYKSHAYFRKGDEFRKHKGQVVSGLVGMGAFSAGPTVHVIDQHGLTDPLLARLEYKGDDWRIGHFVRHLPRGYVKTLRTGENTT